MLLCLTFNFRDKCVLFFYSELSKNYGLGAGDSIIYVLGLDVVHEKYNPKLEDRI